MLRNSATVGAIIGTALMALSLAGSSETPVNQSRLSNRELLSEAKRLNALGKTAFADGRYHDAHDAFRAAAITFSQAGSPRQTALNWSNAGGVAQVYMDYRTALGDLLRARAIAEDAGAVKSLASALNNISSLYLQTGDYENALRISTESLAGPAGHADRGVTAKLLLQQAQSLAELKRFPEAWPIFRKAIAGMIAEKDFEAAFRSSSILGSQYIKAGRYEDAEQALGEALKLAGSHDLKDTTFALTSMGTLRGKQGHLATAEVFFARALAANESIDPRWNVYCERGEVRLAAGKTASALKDFQEARKLAVQLRADIVPADRGRIVLENGVRQVFDGLVNSGNRLALETYDNAILADTFDAAEQDRLWSLRAILPEASDWRSRLPPHYWELLVRFQAVERMLLTAPSPQLEQQTAELQNSLQAAEAAAAADGIRTSADSPLRHARNFLPADAAIFSFRLTQTESWLWVVDHRHLSVHRLPPLPQIRAEVDVFNKALETGGDSMASGRKLYASLFSGVPSAILSHRRWLLEPDGPLYDLPFAALPSGIGTKSGYLIERASLQTIPGALLLEAGRIPELGSFLGIGDPVFSPSDPRYRGKVARRSVMLPRLPNTAAEVETCSRAWATDSVRLLVGSAATSNSVGAALTSSPAIIHFATHVVRAPGEYGSGMIALGLDPQGAIGLIGPKDIAARPVGGALVVMNGCHSAQGETLPASGLMGLTRAWIGAGARAVISTKWDVPDNATQTLMSSFYRALRTSARGNPAEALRKAQMEALQSGGSDSRPRSWAGYFLLSRI